MVTKREYMIVGYITVITAPTWYDSRYDNLTLLGQCLGKSGTWPQWGYPAIIWDYSGIYLEYVCIYIYIYIYNGIYKQVDDGNFWNVGKLHMWTSP